jgi:proteasome accessory factor B
MSAPKTARWLDLIAYLLQHHFPVTREQIFRHVSGYAAGAGAAAKGPPPRRKPERASAGETEPLSEGESARRKFERDKDQLRALGIEIETVPLPQAAGDEPQTGYRLKARAVYLPYFELASAADAPERPYAGLPRVVLTDQELAVLDRATHRLARRAEFPLAAATASARRKLGFDLPLDEAGVEQVLAAPLPEAGRHALEVLQQGTVSRTPVRCRYYSMTRDAEERQSLEPYGLFFQRSHWYCVARVRHEDTVRVFRVDRMREAEPLNGSSTFEIPRGFDVRSYLGRAPWELGQGPATTVRVRFAFPEARWVVNRGLGRVSDPLTEDGGAIVEFPVRDRASFCRLLLTFRRQATVLEPEDLARELETLRRKVAALYETGDA